jgi:excisionase family DNA binding protein
MKILTTSEVAERLGVTVQRIHQFIKDERLPAQKMGRDYIIREGDLKPLEDRKPGRPPKAQPGTRKRVTAAAITEARQRHSKPGPVPKAKPAQSNGKKRGKK